MTDANTTITACPACSAGPLETFHHQASVPTNSCLLLGDEAEAREFTRAPLTLALCPACGFITNTAFDPDLTEYSDRYEETQAFSARFTDFAGALASRWVDRHDLAGRTVLEIGSGKGEFLVMMAEAGIGRGVGIDPGVHVDRIDSTAADRLTWVAARFDDEWAGGAGAEIRPAAIVCRHTLEHIHQVEAFVSSIRRYVGDHGDTVVLFELPDTLRVLEDVAFWDIYYEHCSYFTAGSLARLFERCGFEVGDIRLAYDEQYLVLEAHPAPVGGPVVWPVDDMGAIRSGVERFRSGYAATLSDWRARLGRLSGEGGVVVIWGAGSKGVAFLAEVGEHVAAAVDINPHKHGMFMAGTAHRIIAPGDLVEIAPDLVVVMNPIYLDEIGADLERLGIHAEVVAL